MSPNTRRANLTGLQKWKGCMVEKIFADYGPTPFRGRVSEVDEADRRPHARPFHIAYNDGDEEWISLQELMAIVVGSSYAVRQPSAAPAKRRRDTPARRRVAAAKRQQKTLSRAKRAASAGVQALLRKEQEVHDEDEDRKDDDDEDNEDEGDEEEAEEQGESEEELPAQAKGRRGRRAKAAAAAAPAANGMLASVPQRSSARSAGAATAGPSSRARSSRGAAAAASIDTAGVIKDVVRGTRRQAEQAAESDIVRIPGSSVPSGSQVVVNNGAAYVVCTSSSSGNATSGAQARQVLSDLDACLRAAGSRKERLLTVRVHLRDIEQDSGSWDLAWASFLRGAPRPVAVVVGAGLSSECGSIMLEATAALNPRS